MQDKSVALVTGANQGIGLQIAKELVAHGFSVLLGSRNLERGEAAAKEVGPDARALQLNVTDPASIAASAERVRSEFGRLDVLPLLRKAPHARIVNVSSGVGSLTRNSGSAFAYRSIFGPVYPASKTALNTLTVAMAIELESEGIKVNAGSPGFTKTNLNNYAGTETVEQGAREAVRVALLGTDGVIPW